MTSVLVEHRDGAAIVTMNRPDSMNAFDRPLVERIAEVGRRLENEASHRAVVITGAGDKAFSAGADLKERRGMSEDRVRELLRFYRVAFAWLETHSRPVIAAINGVALGGGLEIALLADLRVAAPTAVLGLPETSLGIIPGAGGTQRLPRLLGEAKAKELILLGRRVEAPEALALGLVNRVSPAGKDVLEDTLEFIEPIRKGAPVAQSAALAAIDIAVSRPLDEGLTEELTLYERCLSTEYRREALEAFAEKRRPVFRGR
jgi:methylglutaconyl-CoA hydratase